MQIINNAIHETFGDNRLNNGLSVRQCVAVDNYEDPNSPNYADIVDYESWVDIPDSQMPFFGTHGVLVHGGTDGCLFHLPAALVYVSRNINTLSQYGLTWHILSNIIFQLENNEIQKLLNRCQKEAIVSWLKYIQSHLEESSSFIDDIVVLYHQLRS